MDSLIPEVMLYHCPCFLLFDHTANPEQNSCLLGTKSRDVAGMVDHRLYNSHTEQHPVPLGHVEVSVT